MKNDQYIFEQIQNPMRTNTMVSWNLNMKRYIYTIMTIIMSCLLFSCVGEININQKTSNNNDKPNIYSINSVYLDAATQIPLPNGNGVQTGIYIHNDNDYNVSGINYFVDNVSSTNNFDISMTIPSVNKIFNQLGVLNPYANNLSGFIIDPSSAQLCSTITAKSSCFLQFYVPSVDKTNRGSAIIRFTNGSFSGSQIISWYDFGDPTIMINGLEFGNYVANVSQNRALTTYVIGTGKSGTIVKDINFDIVPLNVMEMGQGFPPGSQIASTQVVAIEFIPTQNSSQVVNTLIIPHTINGLNYTPLSFQIIPPAQGNLIMGNVPILTNVNKTITINLRNNGNADINNLQIIVPESIVSITANSCYQTLIANGSCNYTIQVISNLENNQNADIKYTYQGGSKQQQLTYINESTLTNNPYLSISSSRNEITTNTGVSINLNFVVTNLSGISQALLESYFTYSANTPMATMSIINNQCIGKVLNKNDSCIIYTQFKGTAIGSNGLYVGFKVKYNNKDYYFKGGMDYVMSNLSGIVTLSPVSFNFNITGNGTSTATQTVNIINSGNAQLNIESLYLESLDSHFIVDSNSCLTKKILLANESCSVGITIQPKTTFISESGINNLVVEFQSSAKNYAAKSNFTWQIMPMDTQLSITNVQLTNIATGSGTMGVPYQSWSMEANPMVAITYKNNSATTKMTNFALDTNLINSYWQVDSSLSTCGYGIKTTTLNAGESCVLTLIFESTYTTNVASVSTNINFPSASWNAYGELITQNSINYNSQASLYFVYKNLSTTVTLEHNNDNYRTKKLLLSTLSATRPATITISAVSADIIPTVSGGGCTVNIVGSVTCTDLGSTSATITYVIPNWVIPPLTVPLIFTADKPVFFSNINNSKIAIFNFTN